MRILLVTGLTVLALSFSSSTVNAQSDTTNQTVTSTKVTAVINDVEIPMDTLVGIQMEYQGQAVTQAKKMSRNNKIVYQLRVDRDDIPDDYTSFYLYFDEAWKLQTKEQLAAPPSPNPVKTEEKKEEKKEEAKPQQTEKPEGGRGAGSGSDEKDEAPNATPEPVVKPEEPADTTQSEADTTGE